MTAALRRPGRRARASRRWSASPASCSRPFRRGRAVVGRPSACSSSPTSISRRARPSPGAASCCRPTTRARRCAGSGALVARFEPAHRRRARRQLPRRRRRRAASAPRPRRRSRRCSAAATSSGSPATTTRRGRPASPAAHMAELAIGPVDLPPRAAARRRGRDRRPPPPLGAGRRARPLGAAAAASPATATGWSCPPSAPMPAASTCSTGLRADPAPGDAALLDDRGAAHL